MFKRLVGAALVATIAVFSLPALATHTSGASESGGIPAGSGSQTATIKGTSLKIYTYRPSRCTPTAILYVAHGMGRNAEGYRDSSRRLADRHCYISVVPLFDSSRFPSWKYQRGGAVNTSGQVQPYDKWTVHYVEAIVAWARGKMNNATMPYYLFGHSAGGQFLSRVAGYAPPDDAQRIVIANPSTHVWPTFDEALPYGFGKLPSGLNATTMLRDYLTAPVTIYLGSEDTDDEDLAMGKAAMRQGENRLERGLNVYRLAERIAKSNGWQFGWKLVIAEGVGHTAGGMLRAPEANEAFGIGAP